MTDVFAEQEPASFRGIEFPVASRDSSHSHDVVKHGIQYRQEKVLEITGAQNLTFTYTIPFRQDIARGPYRNLFTRTLPLFFDAYLNKEPGELKDPVYGVFQVRPVSWDDSTDVNRRDGTDIRIQFMESPDIDTDQASAGIDTINNVAAATQRLDDTVEAQDWKQEPSPEPTTDPFSLVSGTLSQLDFQKNKVNNTLADVAFRAEKVERAAEKLEDPKKAEIERDARRIQLSAARMQGRAVNPARTVRSTVLDRDMTMSAAAARYSNTFDEFVLLNPILPPLILAGTFINYYVNRG